MALHTIFLRSFRLLCPRCGQSKLFCNWFKMHSRCSNCDLDFERDPGFYLGSIYINYSLTAILVTVGYLVCSMTGAVSPDYLIWLALAFCVLFPVVFFRWARSLFLGLDQFFDSANREGQKSLPDNDRSED